MERSSQILLVLLSLSTLISSSFEVGMVPRLLRLLRIKASLFGSLARPGILKSTGCSTTSPFNWYLPCRLLRPGNGYTHGLFSRFLTTQALENYYTSDFFQTAIQPMIPFLKGEDSVDYSSPLEHADPAEKFKGEVVHVCFFKLKANVMQNETQSLISKLKNLANAMPSTVLQVTSESAVKNFYGHPSYKEVVAEIKQSSTLFVEADFLPVDYHSLGSMSSVRPYSPVPASKEPPESFARNKDISQYKCMALDICDARPGQSPGSRRHKHQP
ncbi:hypothetical protein SELMODRAFT_403916 [Selaginella moellendorffii]|uniref:Stress-response A/B barrel domain-containing protein n=1 Tax=Selaginella moellendorffii TaxID=88036 RepID=D8QSZ2_SELML|nr:hypothetical protein SELMODRAFT_403916 [Selaginella moellendorffii]